MVIILLIVIGVAALGWWLLVTTEGVYLGRRVVIALYDLYARRYDHIKQFDPRYEYILVSRPIMGEITPQTDPLVLDVATGTGRLPIALCKHDLFEGRVIGVDLSRRMLREAARKLKGEPRVDLIWCGAEQLPFAEGTFDVVTCLEALEFMPGPAAVLRECIRVLRPGGVLLITNRINVRMPGKLWTDKEVHALLASFGVGVSETELWQEDYTKVWGLKDGESTPTGAKRLDEVLRCPRCPEALTRREKDSYVCVNCAGRAKVGGDGVIELLPLIYTDSRKKFTASTSAS